MSRGNGKEKRRRKREKAGERTRGQACRVVGELDEELRRRRTEKRFESWRAGSDTVQAFSIIHFHCIRASFGTLNTKTHPPHLYRCFPFLAFLSLPELHCFSHPCLSVFIAHPFISILLMFMLTHLVTV